MHRRSALLLALVAVQALAQGPLPPQPTIKLNAGIHVITAEIAADRTAITRGLMFRERLAPNHGMLFVHGDKVAACMWMRNTLIPLSVAFIEDDGSIVNIEDMQPQSDQSHCALKPVRYVLEMEQGWFAKRGMKSGSKIGGLPKPQ